MSGRVSFSDASLEAMLRRRSNRSDPSGLREAAFGAVEATSPRRGPSLGWPAVRFPWVPSRRAEWVLVAATLLLALLGSALVGASLFRDPTAPVRAITGIETLNAEVTYDKVVVDGLGTFWAVGPGNVTRFDPAGGERRTWTITDDLGLAEMMSAAPARDGGLWLWSRDGIRRFDGAPLQEVTPGPPGWDRYSPAELAEAPDGSLWAATPEGGLVRWDGTAWKTAPAGRPTEGAKGLLVTPTGDVWVVDATPGESGPVVAHGVSRLRDGRWTSFDVTDARALTTTCHTLTVSGDGAIWAASADDVARFDGDRWTDVDAPWGTLSAMSAGSDGSAWVTGYQNSEPFVARLGDGTWTRYGLDQGLVGWPRGAVLAAREGAFVATAAGLHRLERDGWRSAWPDASGPGALGALMTVDSLVPVGAEEAWALDGRGIWHYLDGAWTGPLAPHAPSPPTVMAVAPDGAVWAATDGRGSMLRNGEWTDFGYGYEIWRIAVGSDGSVWTATGESSTVVRRDPATGEEMLAVACVDLQLLGPVPDGSVYLAGFGYVASGLHVIRDGTCERVDPLGDGKRYHATDLETDADGRVLAILGEDLAEVPEAGGAWSSYVVLLERGRWSVIDSATRDRSIGLVFPFGDVAFAPDGAIWHAATAIEGGGIRRFDGARWQTIVPGIQATELSFGPDGSLWFAGPSGIQRIGADALAGVVAASPQPSPAP
jgi:streptogramin lyase